jgi:RHS repeat-associated protein
MQKHARIATPRSKNMRQVRRQQSHPGIWLCLLFLLLGLAESVRAQDPVNRVGETLTALLAPVPAVQPGQSASLLPDGRWLLLGGLRSSGAPSAEASIVDLASGRVAAVGTGLQYPRSGHSATLLPNGQVLVLGGVDAAGAVLTAAEAFDPTSRQFRTIGDPGLIPRVGHTATVLADGRLLISGGLDQHGRAVTEAEIYDPVARKVAPLGARLDTPRTNHSAALLAGSDVLLWGGTGEDRKPVAGGDLYQFDSQRFRSIDANSAAALGLSLAPSGTPSVKSSLPAAEASAVPIDRALAVHFAQRMKVTTLDENTVTLIGPHGAVPIKVVPVEYGLLVFVSPVQQLLPASRYTLFIKGATDMAGQALPFTAIGFDTMQLDAPAAPTLVTTEGATAPGAPAQAAGAGTASQQGGGRQQSAAQLNAVEIQAIAAAGSLPDAEGWTPNQANFKGDWRAKRVRSPLQDLPPLRAPEGTTALAGQVLTLNGRALPDVTLSAGGQTARTDATGRFLLAGLAAGDQVLTIDGQSADRGGVRYGVYQVRVAIEKGQTNVLGYTIWSPSLDPAGSIAIASPTTRETVLMSPRIPGLELHIPPGMVIRDRNGKVVTQINMTAIPTDRPPFPIPDVGVPVYFTLQPGGAKLVATTSRTQQGAQLIYPNFSDAPPGTRIDFWNYDTERKGWYVYGQGTVSKDGRQVIPDAGVAIYEFTGAMIAVPASAPPSGPPPGNCPGGAGGPDGGDPGEMACNGDPNQPPTPPGCGGDPVDCATGLFLHSSTDLTIKDVVPIKIDRTYRPGDNAMRAFGIGTTLAYDFFLVGDTFPWTYQELILPDGGRVRFNRISSGTSWTDAVYKHTSTGTKYYGAIIRYKGESACYWELSLKSGGRTCFPESFLSSNARRAAAVSISDRYGNTVQLTRDSNGNVTRITSPSGRFVDLAYDASNRIIRASDNGGRTLAYEYDAGGRLAKATGPDGKFEAYTYDARNNMLTVQDRRGNMMVTNAYDTNDKVIRQTYADGSTNLFAYTLGSGNKVTRTEVTDERGIVTRMQFDAKGYVTELTKALGLPEQQVTKIERDPATGLVTSITDPLGRKTAYTYDANGNQTSVTVLSGTAGALTTTMTYTPDFNKLASFTDVLGHTTTITYDARGNRIGVRDGNGNQVGASYNGAGQVTGTTDGLGNAVKLAYVGYDLAQITDPLGRSVNLFADSLGRVRSLSDSLGNRTVFERDLQDRVTKTIDPLGRAISQAFDAESNLTGVTDPKGNVHQFAFDSRNGTSSETDPLGQAESYVYDRKHNLTQKTDRKGQVTRYTYDALDRLTTTTFADGSTVTVSYDQGNRPTQIVDSLNGAIALTYDVLGRVTQTSTPKGKVNYTYYANGLRQSMTVAGQPTISYTYDNGNRLTRIEQAAGPANNNVAQRISFTYDAADRRIQATYANGITRTNSYDNAGQLVGITYKKADGSPVGDLVYTYDDAGRRTSVSGSLARTALPAALSNASVDAANRLLTADAQSFQYDANGNVVSDGSQRYVWNARNQLVQIQNASGGVIASFTYDALGRRQAKVVNGIARGFVYDGNNIVQELAGATVDNSNPANVKASYISGGIDEVFVQTSGTGSSARVLIYLSDAVGSTIWLTDDVGNKVAGYAYDPYGNTSADGTADNPFQYTGRENDGNGLYYYRARYYSPSVGRFISRDPIGLYGGINTYQYVGGNPLSRVDPHGRSFIYVAAAVIFVGVAIYDAYEWWHQGKEAVQHAQEYQSAAQHEQDQIDQAMHPAKGRKIDDGATCRKQDAERELLRDAATMARKTPPGTTLNPSLGLGGDANEVITHIRR